MNPERLKQLRQSWADRRGSRTVLALIDALEAADRMRDEYWCDRPGGCRVDPCAACEAAQLYDAAKARI